MKFHHLIDKLTEAVPTYLQPIFKTIIIGLLISKDGGRISVIFRHFGGIFAGTDITAHRDEVSYKLRLLRATPRMPQGGDS